jgi:hypothetical protein
MRWLRADCGDGSPGRRIEALHGFVAMRRSVPRNKYDGATRLRGRMRTIGEQAVSALADGRSWPDPESTVAGPSQALQRGSDRGSCSAVSSGACPHFRAGTCHRMRRLPCRSFRARAGALPRRLQMMQRYFGRTVEPHRNNRRSGTERGIWATWRPRSSPRRVATMGWTGRIRPMIPPRGNRMAGWLDARSPTALMVSAVLSCVDCGLLYRGPCSSAGKRQGP